MKEELYKYAISIKNLGNQKVNFADVETFILLGIFSLPILLLNILLFLPFALSYILLIFYSKKERDVYAKMLFEAGLFFAYLALELCFAILVRYPNFMFFLILIPICILIYEVCVLVGIKNKKYSKNTKKYGKAVGSTTAIGGCLTGGGIGRYLDRNFSENSFVISMVSLIPILMIVLSITFIQKYIIYKTYNKTES